MRVLVDTPIWSAALRRPIDKEEANRKELAELVQLGLVDLIGPIRQELLSGIRDKRQYEAIRSQLRSFPDLPILTDDYELAADFYSRCRAKGIQGSSIDFLICAVSQRYHLEIFTDDHDFVAYASVLPIKLYRIGTHPTSS